MHLDRRGPKTIVVFDLQIETTCGQPASLLPWAMNGDDSIEYWMFIHALECRMPTTFSGVVAYKMLNLTLVQTCGVFLPVIEKDGKVFPCRPCTCGKIRG